MASLEELLSEMNELLQHEEENIFDLVCVQNKLLQLSYELMKVPFALETFRVGDTEKYYQFVNAVAKRSKEISRKIAATAIYEPKTGLLNIASFDAILGAHFSSCEKEKCSDIVEAIFDIDFFKNVNETFGYEVADRVLIQVVNIILNNLRKPTIQTPFEQAMFLLESYSRANGFLKEFNENKDEMVHKYKYSFVSIGGIFSSTNESILYEIITSYINPSETTENFALHLPIVGTEAFIFDFATLLKYEDAGRFGGEEIVVVFPDTSLEEGYEKCERIRRDIEKYFTFYPIRDNTVNGNLTISFGLQSYQQMRYYKNPLELFRKRETLPKKELFREANAGLYVAKQLGRNRGFTFTDALTQVVNIEQKHCQREFCEKLDLTSEDLPHILSAVKPLA